MQRPIRNFLPDYLYLLAIAGATVLLDQASKGLVRANLGFTDVWAPVEFLAPFARIVHWKNTGAAFGIFQNGSLLFTILAILVSLTILNYYPVIPRADRWLRTALALQMGGAMGNLIDRLTLGYVVDFISVLRLPVFNIADLSIFIGVILILLPALPHLSGEMAESRLMRQSRQMNGRGRRDLDPVASSEEPISLGMLEVLFAETATMRSFLMDQSVRRIRRQVGAWKRGSSRGG